MSKAEGLQLSQLIETMANDNNNADGTPPWLMPVAKEDEDAKRSLLAPRALIAGVAIGVVALFSGLIWMMYSQSDDAGAVIVVEAPEGPFKVEPPERGGMEVPHQDKLVFDRVSGERSEVAEELRPSPEMPLDRPAVPALESAELQTPDVAPQEPSAAAPAAPQQLADAGIDAALPADAWAVQIGAFRTKNTARAWAVRQKHGHEAVFGGLGMAVQEGEKDMMTYYRVRIGPLDSRQAALAKCAEVKKVGLNCLIVAPGT